MGQPNGKRADSFQPPERGQDRVQLRAELEQFEQLLETLKVQYEQFFAGVIAIPPDKLHVEFKGLRRRILSAPFKNSELTFRFRSLESRYHTYRSYWERVMRQREAGVYSRDLFKASLRTGRARQEDFSHTAEGRAHHALEALFHRYQQALQREAGRRVPVDFDVFKQLVLQRAKEFKAQHGAAALTFRIVRSNGQVVIQALPKSNSTDRME